MSTATPHFDTAVRAVSQDEREQFARDGMVLLEGLIDPTAARRLVEEVDHCLTPGTGFRLGAGMISSNRVFNEFVFGSQIGTAGAKLLNAEKLRLYVDNLFVKEPATDEPLNWHNDLPYYPFNDGRIVSIWIALADAGPEMSPLQLIPGSHHWNKWFKPHIPSNSQAVRERVEGIDLEPCPDFTSLDAEYPGAINIVSYPMKAGDAVAFTALTAHHSGPNRSVDKRRIGYSLRFLAEDVIWDPRPNTLHEIPGKVLKAGQPVDDFFPLLWTRDGSPCDRGEDFLNIDQDQDWKLQALTGQSARP